MKTGREVLRAATFLLVAFAPFTILLRDSANARAQVPNGEGEPYYLSGQQQYQQLIRSVSGPDLFAAYCASCHGLDARGHGPASASLKAKVPDLTALTKNSKGEFPADRVRKAIMGDDLPASHGSRLMPVWGPIFHQIEWDVDRGNVRLENLVEYLESIQELESPHGAGAASGQNSASQASVSGERLYRRYCAACHANDLKGNGPAPFPFLDKTPDLTTLARRHGGKFPDEYVLDVLRNGVSIPAHGPPEMPTWGADFRTMDGLTQAQITARLANLRDYIKTHQVH